MPRRILALVLTTALCGASYAGEHLVSASLGYDSNACPDGLEADASTLSLAGSYRYEGERADVSIEGRRGPSGANCLEDSNAFDIDMERRIGMPWGYALIDVGHQRHGVVDRWGPGAGDLATGSYRSDKLGVGAGTRLGPVLVEASYNGLDGAHPLYVEASVDGPFGSRLSADVRCPLGDYSETPTLAYECFAETELSVQRDFQDSRFGVELSVTYVWNQDSLSGHYSWQDCGMVDGMEVCPGLPSDRLGVGVALTSRF